MTKAKTPYPGQPAAPPTPDGAAEPRKNIPFHEHLARIRALEKSQKPTPGFSTPKLTPAMQQFAQGLKMEQAELRGGRERFVALRKRAVELEAAKLYEQALGVYLQLVNALDDCPEDLEIALLNRVGDLMTRVGRAAQAADYYEMAADKYATRGLADNAIAVYNKILRSSPSRTPIYLKIARLAAKKGLKADAKRNYLEYASRVKVTRNYDEAFRALAEFVDYFPDQDDIRLALIDQLQVAGYQDEMIKQLEALFKYYRGTGRMEDARQIAARLEAYVPKFAG
jgi:tetratricopeptide (TPR) repeat protein